MAQTTMSNVRMEEKLDGIILSQGKLSESQDKLFCSFNEFKINYTGAHVLVEQKANSAIEKNEELEKRMEKLEGELDKLKDAVKPLVIQAKILGWLAAAFGFSVVALIWAVLTHSVELIRP